MGLGIVALGLSGEFVVSGQVVWFGVVLVGLLVWCWLIVLYTILCVLVLFGLVWLPDVRCVSFMMLCLLLLCRCLFNIWCAFCCRLYSLDCLLWSFGLGVGCWIAFRGDAFMVLIVLCIAP